MLRKAHSLAVALAALAMPVAAAEDAARQPETSGSGAQISDVKIIKLANWDYERLYKLGGVRADRLMKSKALGPDGEEIGSIENVIIDGNNRAVALIAQVGGLWDIGDTHVAIPWKEVEVTRDGVTTPVREDNLQNYSLFDSKHITPRNLEQTTRVEDDVETGYRSWKLTSLLNDYATLNGGVGYGYVNDVVLSRDGEIQAVIIEAATRYGTGPYAYPFYGYDQDWNPAFETYSLPYDESEARELDPIDYERLKSNSDQ